MVDFPRLRIARIGSRTGAENVKTCSIVVGPPVIRRMSGIGGELLTSGEVYVELPTDQYEDVEVRTAPG